ncbi:IS1096 element passenger TnpR family protein [Legionella cincinnatiensis]|nr:hypothetical protein [Legionella cincinnatiensis]
MLFKPFMNGITNSFISFTFMEDYGINYDDGLGYSDNAYKVCLDDFVFDVGDKFTYEYNFFEHLMHDIRVENVKAH